MHREETTATMQLTPTQLTPKQRVEAFIEPYNRTLDLYQSYYRFSIARHCKSEGILFQEKAPRFAPLLRFLGRVRRPTRFRWVNRAQEIPLLSLAARLLGVDPGLEHAVGRYVLHSDGAELKICIDAQDFGNIGQPELLEWCDLYFKTNYWPQAAYPSKVVPLANLNPLVRPSLPRLTQYRTSETEWDVFGFFRVWGGRDEIEGIEHNLALFEALARLKCRKKLLAVLVAGDIAGAAARLEKAGIPWTTKWMPINDFWRTAARSKLTIVRHGMHQCIPWRMTDVMAMGHCPVLDYRATTRWPVPLQEYEHYLHLGLPYDPSGSVPFYADAVTDRIHSWLAEEGLIDSIGRSAGRYFDDHLIPERLGQHIIAVAKQHLS
jgi:hypothetical protein